MDSLGYGVENQPLLSTGGDASDSSTGDMAMTSSHHVAFITQ
jgi:hypothetical protein